MSDMYAKVKSSVLMARVLALSVGDLFTRPMLVLSLLITLVPIAVWSLVYLIFHTAITGFAHDLIAYVPFATAAWMENIATTVLLIFLFYQLVLLSVIFALGFFVKQIVWQINDKHYQLVLKEHAGTTQNILAALRSGGLFLLLYLLMLPTLFIPWLNVAIHLILWAVLLRGSLIPYSAGLVLSRTRYLELTHEHLWGLVALFLLLSVLYIIPVIGIFASVFQLIVVIHYVLSRDAETQTMHSQSET